MEYNEQFVINKIVINADCDKKLLKNLSPGTYYLSKGLLPGFFGKNISISALVGKNGSGKTSLLDILCRMSNNLAAFLNKGKTNAPYFIVGLDVDVYYSIFNKTTKISTECIFQCRKHSLGFVFGNERIKLEVSKNTEFDDYEDCTKKIDKVKKRLALYYYFTIVTNFSIFSNVTDEFVDEEILYFDVKNNKWQTINDGTWIEKISSKLLSVDCPLTYNPERNTNIINKLNAYNNIKLSIEKILLYFKLEELAVKEEMAKHEDQTEKKRLEKRIPNYLHNYHFEYIKYNISKKKYTELSAGLLAKANSEIYNFSSSKNPIVALLEKCYELEGSIVRIILKTNNISKPCCDNELLSIMRFYYCYEVLACAEERLKPVLLKQCGLLDYISDLDVQKKVAKKIKSAMKDSFYNFEEIERCENFFKMEQYIDLEKIMYFTDSDYINWQPEGIKRSSITIIKRIPPRIFEREIVFKKNTDSKELRCSYEKLSSGEKQFLINTSSLIEHIIKARSLSRHYRYRNFNIVLDEIELCFHPEYQRTFLFNLTYLLAQLNLNDGIYINLILSTHSPFILSDIPQSNILYLVNGQTHEAVHDIRNPFASNINDILRQSFFLDNGMMGEIAKNKLLNLISFLSNYDKKENKAFDHELPINLINHVGDKFLKSKLIELLNNFYKNHPALLEEKEKLSKDSQLGKDEIEKKIFLLEKELEYLKKQQQE